jgi:hypothetical protein
MRDHEPGALRGREAAVPVAVAGRARADEVDDDRLEEVVLVAGRGEAPIALPTPPLAGLHDLRAVRVARAGAVQVHETSVSLPGPARNALNVLHGSSMRPLVRS